MITRNKKRKNFGLNKFSNESFLSDFSLPKAKKSLGLNKFSRENLSSDFSLPKAKKNLGLNKFSRENLSSDFSLPKAKKNLGQNFLKSEKALSKICEAGELSKEDFVLEIGPGLGVLTDKLLECGANVLAVEKDRDLVSILENKFNKQIKNKKLKLISEDILKFSIPKEIKKYKIIANIPYNITGAIFKKFLEEEVQPNKMVLLIQKEVAERIMAKDKKESILSVSIKVYGQPKYLMTVGRGAFSPSPKVDSAIIEIANLNKNNFTNKNSEKLFFRILKAGFAHKRKLVFRNLLDIFDQENLIKNIFEELSISPNSRAEDLSVKNWVDINNKVLKSGVLIK